MSWDDGMKADGPQLPDEPVTPERTDMKTVKPLDETPKLGRAQANLMEKRICVALHELLPFLQNSLVAEAAAVATRVATEHTRILFGA